MRRKIKYYRLLWLKYDLQAGLSVFFIALPLCLAIAKASGAPVYAGILSGIIGGLVVPLISGSALGVSGPAAGLTTLVSASIISFGDYRIFLLTVIVAGLFQVALGILRLGVIANYFPSSVIKGMMAAIGVILISKQIPLVVGYDQPDFWTSRFSQLFASADITGNIRAFDRYVNPASISITVLSLGIYWLLKQPFANKIKVLPASLVIVLVGIAINLGLQLWLPAHALKTSQLVSVPSNVFANIAFPDISRLFHDSKIWESGALIGLLATLETLLCAEAIDKLDKHNRITPVNRELLAQGAGNIICGLLGAIPITAVVVRGAANVDAGARTKLSAFTHGLFLLLAVLAVPRLLNLIPFASLAAILLITGYNLTKPKLYRNLWSLGWKQFIPFIITIIVILRTDLLVGVSIGLLISIYFIIQNNFRAEYNITEMTEGGKEVFNIKLNSNVTFLNKVKLKKALDRIPEYSLLTIDGSHCNFIDYDILEIISEYEAKAQDRYIMVTLIGISKVNVSAIH